MTKRREIAVLAAFFCLDLSRVERTGQFSCWVSTRDDQGREICLSQEAWRSVLRAPSAERCFEGREEWKVSQARRNPGLSNGSVERVRVRFRELWVAPREEGVLRRLASRMGRAIEDGRERISVAVRPGDRSGILRKLLIGESSPETHAGFLRLLGFVHVFSSSGIHLYACLAAIQALGFFLVCRTRLSVSGGIRAVEIASWIVFLFAWVLQGMRLGMLRPLIVLVLRRAALAMGIRWRLWAPLAAAILLDAAAAFARWLFFDAPLSSGGLHYALAVGAGLGAWELARKESAGRRHLALAVGSWLGTAVWDAASTGWISAFTPIASLITVPIFGTFVFPLALGGSLVGILTGSFPLRLFEILGRSSSSLLQFLAGISMDGPFLWQVGAWGVWASAALAFFLIPFSMRTRAAVAALLLSVRAGVASWPVEQVSRDVAPFVLQLDVGQGDAALVASARGPTEAGMIDTGPEEALRPEDWLAVFAHAHVRSLRWVLLSHLDADHARGLLRLARLLPIGCVATPEREWESERGRELARFLRECGIALADAGRGCVPFETRDLTSRERGANASMAAIRVPLEGGGTYAGAGDATAQAEQGALAWLRTSDRPLIWKISHHGSKTSSSSDFLRALAPARALVSCGTGNHYGHPSFETLARLRGAGIPFDRTDEEGGVLVEGKRAR